MKLIDALKNTHKTTINSLMTNQYFRLWQNGLTNLINIVPTTNLIDDGEKWQSLRGTKSALTYVFKWLNLGSAIVEEEPTGPHWNEYQINSGKILTPKEVKSLVKLTDLTAPARSKLTRIFHGYDARRLTLSDTNGVIGFNLLSDHSGELVNGIKISFPKEG